jgi:ribA/ribD-fused uncharacterized protein
MAMIIVSEVVDDALYIERGPLLNFWGATMEMRHPHRVGTRLYRTVEHRFQAMKTTCLLSSDESVREHRHDSVADLYKAGWAKTEGRLLEIDVSAWDKVARMVMLEALVSKFSTHKDLRRMLVDTGDRRLVEHRPDPVWGDGMDGTGQNLMGEALMQARALLR